MFKEMKNLYEVRKTVRFELKPGKNTQIFLQYQGIYKKPMNILYKNKLGKGNNYSKQVFEDNIKEKIKDSKNILEILENIGKILKSIKYSEILVNRRIFEQIDKNYYQKIAKKKLSGGRSSSFYEIEKNLEKESIEMINKYFENSLQDIYDLIIKIEDFCSKSNNYSKNEIKKYIRKLSLKFIRIEKFLKYFEVKHDNFNYALKERIEKIFNFSLFFDEIKAYYFLSENKSSGILVRRFGFNEKSLNRRQPKIIKEELEMKEIELKKILEKKLELEKEKQILIENFYKETMKKDFPELLQQDKIKQLREKLDEEKTELEKKFLQKIDNLYKQLKALSKEDDNIKSISQELNSVKQKFGKIKVIINNLEKELENNLALTHYSKLVEKTIEEEKLYYLVLIPIDSKNILDNKIGKLGDSKILEYNTLTFNSLKKLAFSYDGTMGIYWDKEELLNKKSGVKKWVIELYKDLENNKKQEDFFRFKRYVKNLIITYNDVFKNIYFNFFKLDQCKDLETYVKEFNKQGYKLNWKNIDFQSILELEKENKLELYQIYNKDFYKDTYFYNIQYSIKEQKKERLIRREEKNVKGNKNLFSIYWEKFIDEIEIGNDNIRLNSDCGFFIKKASEDIDLEFKGKFRKKRDKIIGSFNLSFNSNKTLGNKLNEKQNIEKFNEIYIKKIPNLNEVTYIGLDRGEKELLTYCVINNKGECLKDDSGNYLIGDFNCINSKGKFVSSKDCFWKDENGKVYKDLIGGFLPDFSHPKNIIEGKKKFQKDENLELYYFKLNHDARFYLLNGEKDRFVIKNKENKNIFFKDKEGNKVINYYLIFQSEVYKRHILNQKNPISLDDIQELRGGYISRIIEQLNKWILKYNGVLCLENLDKVQFNKEGDELIYTNKDQNLIKTFGATIYQELETLLNRKYNYFITKDDNQNTLQLTPKINNITDIRKVEKSYKNINLGNLFFIDEFLTSKKCPRCGGQLNRLKRGGDNVFHDENNPGFKECRFNTKNGLEVYNFDFIKSGDDLAAYNIAKKAKEYLENLKNSQ